MKRYLVMVVLLALTAVGCESMGESTKKGAGLGALTGAAIGGIVGHQDGHGWEGALIGGAAGATTGGLIGAGMDSSERKGSGALSVVDIADMAEKGVPENVIIDEIDRTKSKFDLNSETMNYLRSKGVTDAVIDHMLATM